MTGIVDYIILICMTLYYWLGSFLYHEFMHIRSQGIGAEGTIWVHKFSMTCAAKYVKWPYLYSLAGGLYSGIIHVIVGLLAVYYHAWGFYVPTITFGVVNIAYGIWEAERGAKGRYYIYVATLIIMIVFWVIHYYVWMV